MSTEELDDSVHARKAPLLAFLYGDALVEEIKSDNNIVGPAETVRLSYKAVRESKGLDYSTPLTNTVTTLLAITPNDTCKMRTSYQ